MYLGANLRKIFTLTPLIDKITMIPPETIEDYDYSGVGVETATTT